MGIAIFLWRINEKISIFLTSIVLLVALAVGMSGCGYKWHNFETYAQWLKEDNDFESAERLDINEPYSIGSQMCMQIEEKYKIAEVAGTGNTQEKALNILKWVSDNVVHDGSKMVNLEKFNGYTLLEYGFGTDKGMNCM